MINLTLRILFDTSETKNGTFQSLYMAEGQEDSGRWADVFHCFFSQSSKIKVS